jgi:hypothetical protein
MPVASARPKVAPGLVLGDERGAIILRHNVQFCQTKKGDRTPESIFRKRQQEQPVFSVKNNPFAK